MMISRAVFATRSSRWRGLALVAAAFLGYGAPAQVTFTDNFSAPIDYLTNGVANTIWDGLYLGNAEFAGATGSGDAAGSVSIGNAGITGSGLLTIASVHTDWENAADDGVFLYKVLPGNFDMSVRIAAPIDSGAYNLPGLMVRAFGPGGSPGPSGSENFLLFGRFNQFSIANLSKNNVNGSKTDAARGTYPNTNYWVRIQRSGNAFTLSERATAAAGWTPVGTVTRADLEGLPLQVGIEHAVYGGGSTRTGRFANFTLVASNLTATASPGPAAALTSIALSGSAAQLSWMPGQGSPGSLVALWTGKAAVRQMPAAGTSYSGDAQFGAGSTLPGFNCYVVHSGAGSNVLVSNLTPGETYHAAVFSYAGSGTARVYSHQPSTVSFVATNVVPPAGPLTAAAELEGTNVTVSFNPVQLKWYRVQYSDSLAAPVWKDLSPVAQLATSPVMYARHIGGALDIQRFYRVQQFDAPPVGANLAPNASSSTSYVSTWENLTALNDGADPVNSSDHSFGAYGNWPQTGTQWVEYEWPVEITTCRSDVYWWSDGGGIMPPVGCRLKYWDGVQYVPVSDPQGLGVDLDQYNVTTFSPVTTTRIRLEFDSGTASTGILEWKVYDAGNSPTNWPGAPETSSFVVKLNSGAISGLRFKQDVFPTEYLSGRLGELNLKYRQGSGAWVGAQTSALDSAAKFGWALDAPAYYSTYRITNGGAPVFAVQNAFDFSDDNAISWTVALTNLTSQPLEIGDLAVPFPMNTTFSGPASSVFKHSFVSGHGSWMFWMRPNSAGPYLTLTTADNTSLEYWDRLAAGNVYQAYIHSKAAGEIAAAQGTRWRQTNTSLTLAPGASQVYGFKLRWADGYDAVRDILVSEGKIDVRVAPGMTVPTDLSARFALRTTQGIQSVTAEFPGSTVLSDLGVQGACHLYEVRFARLGENMLTVNYGANRRMFLEFFATEPLETLIQKRSQFLARQQINDSSKWYDGLYPEWNMASQTRVTPDSYDLLVGFVRYEVASDDSGLSRPAYMAVKNAVAPVQSEVTSLDNYISKFVWGGLQRTTSESYPYGVYGVRDWYSNRNSTDAGSGGQLHIWRIYDYPHIVAMYEGMYRVARYYPHIQTALPAQEYLRRACGTAIALFTVPLEVTGWSAYQTCLMNELVIKDLISELEAEGLSAEAANLRTHWERKVNYFVLNNADLFGSEYSFDSTGFETQQALARYGLENASSLMNTNPALYMQKARSFMDVSAAANIFCRGWLEPAYYHYGSDFRQQAGDTYTLSYMAQMGGWAVMDYGLYFATNPAPVLQLAYGSYLSAWALMNTGTSESGYGFWYPGSANDGACGGGFEPSPHNTTWLGQPAHRGAWYYSCEQNLGFCGAIRSAATLLVDDPVFGRFCYGGVVHASGGTNYLSLKDGVRQRFHAKLGGGDLHIVLENDRFAVGDSIAVSDDLRSVGLLVESLTSLAHNAHLRFSASAAGAYTLSDTTGTLATVTLQAGQEASFQLPIPANGGAKSFTLRR